MLLRKFCWANTHSRVTPSDNKMWWRLREDQLLWRWYSFFLVLVVIIISSTRLELIRWQDDWRFFSSISPHHPPHSTLHNPRLLQGIQVCQTVSCCNNHKETKKLTFYDTRYHPIDAKTAKRNYEAASNLNYDYDYEYEENNRDVIIIEEGDDAQQR